MKLSDKLLAREPIDADGLYMRITKHLRAIHTQVGDSIPSESELSRALGVGRQQVREALAVLEGFGALESRQGARRIWHGLDSGSFAYRAATLLANSDESVIELLEVRHALETALLPKAAARLTQRELDELRSLANQMMHRVEEGLSFADLDECFHRTLLAPVGNAVLDGTLQAFWVVFAATNPGQDNVDEDPEIAAMHGQIIDAIEKGDTRLAVYVLDSHFYGIRNRFPNIAFDHGVS